MSRKTKGSRRPGPPPHPRPSDRLIDNAAAPRPSVPRVPAPRAAGGPQAALSMGAPAAEAPGRERVWPAWPRLVIPVAAVLGVLDSLYLSYVKIANAKPYCAGIGDCDTVNASPYSVFAGVPIAYLGVLMYAVLFALAVWGDRLPRSLAPYAPLAILGISFGGVLYSAYLTYVELYILEAICIYCVFSAILVTVIFLWSLWTLLRRPVEA